MSAANIDDLKSRLRESGEAATRVAGSLRAVLESPELGESALEEIMLGLNTRCVEIDELRLTVALSAADDLTKRVAGQLHHLWHEMSKMAAQKAGAGKTR